MKVKAIDEMMDRIKNGVVLKSTQRKTELLNPNASSSGNEGSAVNELKGLLDTMSNRKVRQYSWKKEKKQSELDTILLRRRKVTDTAAGPGKKGTEKPAITQKEEGESVKPALPRASNSNQWEGLKRGRWMQQSRRTSHITALNRRQSQGTVKEAIETPPNQ
ncbi:shootin-1 [Scyliorhinus canicula]|uniref:shootin-1 n=1 Tax=Scyliorhinus canicula TaxID=7830 RepID=UPI0018F42B4D|nr:shootin-1 [Scyliorhinus canicula]